MQNYQNKDLDMLIEAVKKLQAGEVVAFPTETFYGLGVDPTNEAAVTKLLALKDRSAGAGVPFIVDDARRAEHYCEISDPVVREKYFILTNAFWPGPLTVVLPVNPQAKIDPRLLGEGGTIAMRHSSSEVSTLLAAGIGGILPATSANPHGYPPASEYKVVKDYFRDHQVYVVEGESLNAKLPSTLVKITADDLILIRQGAIPYESLASLLS